MVHAVVVGAGHNGLVAATLLARAGLTVQVLERDTVVGGACRTEYPFGRAPGLAASTGAYLLGLMPAELPGILDVDLPLIPRDPHYFLPTRGNGYLLLGSDRERSRRQFAEFFTDEDAAADDALSAEMSALRDDLGPSWLCPPLSVEETAERYVRPALRDVFVRLVRGSVMEHLDRFGFRSDLVKAMYAVTDGMPGLTGSPWTPGSGHSLLVHNMCRLPNSGGTWMVVRGGMGTVTQTIAEAATKAGATIRTGVTVERLEFAGGTVHGVATSDGETVPAEVVLVATDVFRLPGLLGDRLPDQLRARIAEWAAVSPGQTMKVNLATSGLPRFSALPEDHGQYGTTVHLLPDGDVITELRRTFDDAAAGRLPDFPPMEWYLHSTLDESLRDHAGNHSSALFVQGVPHEVAGSGWAAERDAYVDHLLDVVETFAPGMRDMVVDVHALAPPDIRDRFGITSANIMHVNNTVSFTDRVPYALGVPGVYAGAAGCFPAGSVIGAAGHNAARRILDDLDAA